MVQAEDRSQVEVQDLLERLRLAGPVRVALAIDHQGGEAVARHLRIDTQASAAFRPARRWFYGVFELIECNSVPGEDVARWLSDGAGAAAWPEGRTGTTSFTVDVPDQAGWGERLPAYVRRDGFPLAVPHLRVELGRDGGRSVASSNRRWLVGPGAPAFTDESQAMASFFLGSPDGHDMSNPALIVVRLGETGPRIGAVHFGAGGVSVEVVDRDTAAGALRLDLDLGGARAAAPVDADGTALLSVSGTQRSSDWWLVLSEEHRWVDYRQSAFHPDEDAGITYETPNVDADAQVARFIADGECGYLEFKREVPPAKENFKVAKTVAAFANGSGGTIVFGIDKDEVTIRPIDGDFNAIRDRLVSIVEGNVTPRPPLTVERYDTASGLVVGLTVESGTEAPYAVNGSPLQFFTRANASTIPATAAEVRKAVLASVPDVPASRRF